MPVLDDVEGQNAGQLLIGERIAVAHAALGAEEHLRSMLAAGPVPVSEIRSWVEQEKISAAETSTSTVFIIFIQ